ncbi:MAG: tetratricopeptide repeat protein [Acidobacteriaceae bacterium]
MPTARKFAKGKSSILAVPLLLIAAFAFLFQARAQTSGRARNTVATPASLQQSDAAFHAGYAAYAKGDLQTARADFQRVVALVPTMEEGHSALGAVLVQLGQDAKAIPQLTLALALKPTDRAARMNLAVAYSQTGAYRQAVPLFQKMKRKKPGSNTSWPPDVLASYARALAGTHHIPAAIVEMQRAVAAAPTNAIMQDELGSLYAQEKEWVEAATAFTDAIRLDPGLASARLHLGVTRLAQRQLTPAIDELTIASSLLPKSAEPRLELGIALVTAGREEDAVLVLQRAQALDPDSVAIMYQLALALQSSDRVQQAIPLFRQTVAAQPGNTEALTNLALALVQVGKAKEAVDLYRRALQQSPQDVTIHQDLAVAYIQQSDIADAIDELRAGLKLSPDDAALHYNLGLAYKLEDNTAAAITELERCSRLDPTLPDPYYTLGILYMQEGHFNKAAEHLHTALQMRPNNANGWAILGSVYQQQNKFPEATAALKEAIHQEPDRPSPHITLATILAAQGDHAGAKEERKTAARLMQIAVDHQRSEFESNTGDMERQKGQLARAIQSYRQAVQDDPQNATAQQKLSEALQQEGKPPNAADAKRK